MDIDKREEYIRKNIKEINDSLFPESPNVEWKVGEIVHEGELSYVDVDAPPDHLGCLRMKIVVSFSSLRDPEAVGCYCYEDEAWGLIHGRDPNRESYQAPTVGCFGVAALLIFCVTNIFQFIL